MATTIGDTNLSNWRHLQARYIAAAGIVGIMVGLLVAFAPWHQAASPAPAASIAPREFHRAAAPRNAVVYLVASDAEAVALKGMIAAEGGTAGLNESIDVVVVDTAEMEA